MRRGAAARGRTTAGLVWIENIVTEPTRLRSPCKTWRNMDVSPEGGAPYVKDDTIRPSQCDEWPPVLRQPRQRLSHLEWQLRRSPVRHPRNQRVSDNNVAGVSNGTTAFTTFTATDNPKTASGTFAAAPHRGLLPVFGFGRVGDQSEDPAVLVVGHQRFLALGVCPGLQLFAEVRGRSEAESGGALGW
jgi:hypothetical protein